MQKFPNGSRVKIIKNNTAFPSWDDYIGTFGTIDSYDAGLDQPYNVAMDNFEDEYGNVVGFSEDELDYSN